MLTSLPVVPGRGIQSGYSGYRRLHLVYYTHLEVLTDISTSSLRDYYKGRCWMINNQISSYGEKITQIQAIFILNNWDYDKLFMYKKVHFVAGLPLSGCVVLD